MHLCCLCISVRELILDFFFQRRLGSLENMSFSKMIFLHRLFMGNKPVLAGEIIPILHQLGSA